MLKIKKIEHAIRDCSFVLYFENGHQMRVEVEGDCCSSSYFTEGALDELGSIKPGEILTGIEELESGIPEEKNGGTYTKYYFLKIQTDKQTLNLDWRNDSNGYYSGFVNFFYNGPESDLTQEMKDNYRMRLIGPDGKIKKYD